MSVKAIFSLDLFHDVFLSKKIELFSDTYVHVLYVLTRKFFGITNSKSFRLMVGAEKVGAGIAVGQYYLHALPSLAIGHPYIYGGGCSERHTIRVGNHADTKHKTQTKL